jgi:hypothetical protein
LQSLSISFSSVFPAFPFSLASIISVFTFCASSKSEENFENQFEKIKIKIEFSGVKDKRNFFTLQISDPFQLEENGITANKK